MDRYVCVHGHFYQPPRENPWLEAIELQDSAYPYHDWNERISEECYRPNSRARILDDAGWIVKLINNYARMSFNVGPTLLSWMQAHAPRAYARILEADRESAERFSGHGSAMAQNYGHVIMPLANDRDKRTQVTWGIADFRARFGRAPEGMWLAETAADTPTLEVLAELGIRFTVLAPRQAKRVRRIGGEKWIDVRERGIDPSRAYLQRLPSGREIALFFYDGPVSQAVAFERLLNSGEVFAARLMDAFSEKRDWPQLAHIATDGETYGHHHRHGDMALAYALEHIERRGLAKLTNYAEFLEKHPPTHEVEIVEGTSWSCYHGVGRWERDCGCSTGGHPEWNQAWRAPLRNALDWLRDELAPKYQKAAGELLADPWAARDAYISLILDRSDENNDAFFDRHAVRPLDPAERTRALKLLEMQRHAMLMYTSCGWFFDELSGIETVQVIQYAGRAIQLAQETLGMEVEAAFLERLSAAKSNIPEQGDGRRIYERRVRPSFVDLSSVGAHYAISAMFDDVGERETIYSYEAERLDLKRLDAGRTRLDVGRVRLTSRITLERDELSYAVLHLGDHVINGGVCRSLADDRYEAFAQEAQALFDRADFATLLRAMDSAFGGCGYTIASLFKDEQRRIVERVLSSTLESVERAYVNIYEREAPLIRFLCGIDVPPPPALLAPAEYVLNGRVRRALENGIDLDAVHAALAEASRAGVELDEVTLSYAFEEALSTLLARTLAQPEETHRLHEMVEMMAIVRALPFKVDLEPAQNAFYELMIRRRPLQAKKAAAGDAGADEWIDVFDRLGATLRIRVAPPAQK